MDFEAKTNTLVFFVNGKKVRDSAVNPEWTLLEYLRDKLHLTGAKLGCGEGGCGACTVMVSKFQAQSRKILHYSVNSCLAPIGTLHGLAVTTTEGIGSTKTKLHPVQERLAKSHGSQCGFCTPGFVMSMYALLRNNPKPSMEEIEENLVGNLCRCTGYRPILEGFRTFTEGTVEGCGRNDCCKLTKENSRNGNEALNGENNIEGTEVLFDSSAFRPYDPSQDLIFPPELKIQTEIQTQSLVLKSENLTFFRIASLRELLILKKTYPQAKVVVGNTEVGVEVKLKNQTYPVIIHPSDVPELLKVETSDDYVEVGASVPLSRVEAELKKLVNDMPDHKTGVLEAILEMLRWFAGRQIRNVAAFGGNIMTGSPISDLNPIFMAAGATLLFQSADGEREVDFDHQFFTGYRRNVAKPEEVLIKIKIPFTTENEVFMAYKQSRRKDDDIAIVNAAMKVSIETGTWRTSSVSLAFGGMAPVTVMARNTMKILEGRPWDKDLLETGTRSLLDELTLDPAAPGGMVGYRRALTASFFFKFYLKVCKDLRKKGHDLTPPLRVDEEELLASHHETPARSTQFFQNVPEDQERIDPVGRPVVHLSALKQTTGEARYTDDIPRFDNELHAALVFSTRPHAKILSIDDSEALSLTGVKGCFFAKDVPGDNKYGFVKDEEVFASTEVSCVGQVVGIVVAEDRSLAKRAAKLVKVTYQDLANPVFTIKDAVEANSFLEVKTLETGDPARVLAESEFVIEGESYVGGQDHFYLETNAHIAVPHEQNEMTLIASSQGLDMNQIYGAEALGIPSHLLTCKVKRLGGGFGGKETRTVSVTSPLLVAAARLGRPVRITIDRDDDMVFKGGRHPFLGVWKVGFDSKGNISALDVCLYSNGGISLDLSAGVMFRAIYSVDNAYRLENMRVVGKVCKTNLPSNTAFRGFGTPQSCFVMEDILSRVADFLKLHQNEVRQRNFYADSGSLTHYGRVLSECQVRKCWSQVLESSDFTSREKRVEEFNRKNRFKKKGISAIPSKFGVAFGLAHLNQGGVLLLVYRDGSVLISHGGVEMGQGVHTKVIQVASKVLGIPSDLIHISETSTDKVPNASPSAASMCTDLYGMATLNACEEILRRLKPFKKENPEGGWRSWVTAAYLGRVSLATTGFHKTPDVTPCIPEQKKGTPFTYYTYGAAVSEVEIDCLTGDHRVLRVDIVMDVGSSINPAIDIGQIEGAFTQGYGLFVMEQLVYSHEGALFTKGPGSYKLPSVKDIPREFNVSLLRDSPNPRAVLSSKAVGEPPLFSGASVFFAIREAVKANRRSSTGDQPREFKFDSPATAERIRMACSDFITTKIEREDEGRKEKKSSWCLDI